VSVSIPSAGLVEKEAEYWRALGAFVEAFASFESALYRLLVVTARTDESIATAVFSGENGEQTVKLIKRIWRVYPPPRPIQDELTEVFSRFKAINEVRNTILHYGSAITAAHEFFTSKSPRALIPSDAANHRVSPDVLLNMRLDILKCASHLISVVRHPDAPLADRVSHVGSALSRAWLYTPESNQIRKSPKPTRGHRKPR
jgi:hypothetical protein